MKSLTSVYITVATLMLPFFCNGQDKPDTLFLTAAKAKTLEVYNKGIGSHSNLYNGIQYVAATQFNADEGHPFFVSDDWALGSVFYGDNYYENVYLLYDLVSDKVVIEHGYSFFKLQLVSEKIKYFTLQGHTFVRLKEDKLHRIKSGFYDRLYDGKAKVYAVRRKGKLERLATDSKKVIYDDLNRYFIMHDGAYYPVKSKASVIKAAGPQKKELRKYINKNKIRFGSDREKALILSAKFYDNPQPSL